MLEQENTELSAKLTEVEKKRREDLDFATRLEQDAQAALAELNFTSEEAQRFQLAESDAYAASCSCFGSLGKGCLVVGEEGTFG